MAKLPRDEERRLADALRTSIERFEESQKAALTRLKSDLQAALWPADEQRKEAANGRRSDAG